MHRSIVLIILAAAIIIGLLLLPKHSSISTKHPPNDDPWLLVSYNPNNPYGTYLGNGFIGCRIMGEGVGNHNGQPLPCYMAGLYDNEKLIPTPTWSDIRFYDGKTEFKIDKTADYKQVLNMKTGILTTYATWRAERKTLKGKIDVIVSRAEPDLARLHANLTADFHGHVRVKSIQCGNSKLGVDWITGSHFSNTRGSTTTISMALDTDAVVEPDDKLTLDYYVIVYRSVLPKKANSRLQALLKYPARFLNAHKRSMAGLWKRDIIIDGPRCDQQAIHSCMFYLLQSVREGSRWSIPPMGLSNNAFNGHVFWDADLWMFPALVLQHPELARSIVDYRYNTLPGAIANAKEHGFTGAEYAWESGNTGREDTPDGLVYRYERHINGDVALCQWQYFLATDDLDWLRARGYPVLRATADYWVSRVKWIPEKKRYEILQVVPPDENADLVDNSSYTNIIAQMNLKFAQEAAKCIGIAPNPKWLQIAGKMYIPYDTSNKRFMAFDGYKSNWQSKQADPELIIYPLQYNIAGRDMADIYKNTFDYYSRRVHPNGPAMSTSAYCVIAARLGECDRAYDEFVKSYKPYFRGPFNYFNEKASTIYENMCFLTGAAGLIQSVMFGLAGANIDYFAQDNNQILNWYPCLPKQWKSIRIIGVCWHGKKFDVTVSRGNKVNIQQ